MTDRDQTAAELAAELWADPAWVAEHRRREAAFDAESVRLAEAEQPLVGALRGVGLDVSSVWDLPEDGSTNLSREAVRILLEHLARPYDPKIRNGIARALATPEATAHWTTLAGMYVAEQDRQVKDGLAVAVARTASDATCDALLGLIADPQNGPSRVLLLVAAKFPARAGPALERLVDDPNLRTEMPRVLKRLRGRSPSGQAGPPTQPDAAFEEASSGFDREAVAPFLANVVRLELGFRRSDAEKVQAMVDALDKDDEPELRFDLGSGGESGTLLVRAFLDDGDAVDLHFLGSPHVAALIRGEMERMNALTAP